MKRIISILLCSAILVTAVPGMYYAQGFDNPSVYDDVEDNDTSKLQEIDYQLNGGYYVSGYNAPHTYPTAELPDNNDLINQGYEFGGWYDNAEFEGEPVTAVNENDYSGVVVLYAKWIERYYYIEIPESVNVDGYNADLLITAHAGGLYEKDKVSVSVSSDNEWKLVNGNESLNYGLYDTESNEAVVNNTVLTELTPTLQDKIGKYQARLSKTPEYAGTYSDSLTFNITFDTTQYNVQYVTNGGTLYSKEKDEQQERVQLSNQTFEAGTKLSDLPVPGKSGATFLGWCYDAECTDYVNSNDRLLKDVVLYASWSDTQQIKTVNIDTYARSYDVDAKDFTINITSKNTDYTANDVKRLVTIKNTSDSSSETSINVTASSVANGEYTYLVSSSDVWKEGCAYRLEIDDDSLYFTGYDPSIREYDFTVYKPDVRNVELGDDIEYISADDLSNLVVNGTAVDKISVSVMTVGTDGTISQDGTKTTGSFIYDVNTLKAGDKIAVYDGDVMPGLNDSVITDSDVSFFEITSASGNEYSYRGLSAKEILFVPDVFPVNIADDKDNDENNDSVTLVFDKLSFENSDMGEKLGLNADTRVDAGDYLALYSTGSDEAQYALINSVSKTDEDYIITYSIVSWDTVAAAMDIYETDSVSGDSLIKNQDIAAIEENVEQQAVDSGFAQNVADEVAEAVTRTESYQELKSYLSDSLGADVDIYPADEENASEWNDGIALYAGSKKPSVKLDHVRADLSTDLKHFDNVSGLRLALDIGVEIAFSNMKVIVSATFEQEVKININVSGEAIWKVWGIFPYIDDYRVAVSLDLYDYTGIDFNVNIRTEEDDDNESASELDEAINGIAEELKNMMELGTTYISDNSDIATRLEDIGDAGEDRDISVAKSLAQRYSDLLENESDWVELYSKALEESNVRILYIIEVELKVEFVVSANANVSLGMTYWYQNAKRYIYSILVFSRNVTSDTIDLSEEQYEFSVYAMGTLGIRAGIRLSVGIGIISTKLASVGFTAEAGGYAQVWGYLYYQLHYAASQGRTSNSMGAVYLEVGVYMQIDFLAQALAGTFNYNPTLFEKQWPLYSVGSVENVCDFSYEQSDVKDIKMKRDVKTVRLSDNYFEMQYLDMKEGLDDNDEYFKKIFDDNDNYYVISMTNPAFSYDPETNIISVVPGDKPEQDGEMIITWKSQKGSFNTKPITRKISLHWDNLRDGYYIAFQTNGGSIVDTIISKYGKEITKPDDPVKQGYTFAGWYADEALTKKYDIPDVMPDEDTIVYAKWEAAEVSYDIVEYVEGVDGVYSALKTITIKGITGDEVSPVPEDKKGFITPSALTQIIKADGSTKFNYYYARDKYNIKFVSEGEVVSEGDYAYGTLMQTPKVYRPGYEFAGWEPTIRQTVPAEDTTYTAVWQEADDIVYTIKYYLEDDNGNYVLDKVKTRLGTTGANVTAENENYDSTKYILAKDLPEGIVRADGSLVLKVYYDRNTYNITYDANGGIVSNNKLTAKWESNVISPVALKTGFGFGGWYTDKECNNAFDGVMPAKDITLYAKWEAAKVNYAVEHYVEKLGTSDYELLERQVLAADTDSQVIPEVKTMTGFTSPETQTVAVKADGTTVIKYYYKRNVHKLTLIQNNGEDNLVYEYSYGTRISVGRPSRKGYTFTGWDKNIVSVMPDEDVTYSANWKINKYTISFKTDGGNDIVPIIQDYNTEVSAPAIPVKKGYTFTGWDKTFPDKMPAENTVMTAQWMKDTYNIYYNLNGGTADNPDTYQVDSKVIILNTPVRTGYTFAGWSGTGIDGVVAEAVITTGSTGDRTYTANWIENSYTIQFIPYGSGTTGSMNEMVLKYTDTVSISSNNFKRPGYTFVGWSVAAGGDKKYSDNEVISSLTTGNGERITLYPVWTANNYTVHFDTKGDAIDDVIYTYDKKYQLPTATRFGYTFLGWCVEDGGTVTYAPGASADNLVTEGAAVLYASWSLNRSFSYSNSNSYHITDKSSEEPVKFHFIADGRQTSTTGYTRNNVIYMNGISFDDIKEQCNTMTITISYLIKKDVDGYVDMDTTYRKHSDYSWNGWKEEDFGINKNDGKTMTFTYSINCKDVDGVCYRFDAHGTASDKYYLSNVKVDVRFD